MAINNTMTEITTKSSINVKPFGLRMTASLLSRRRFFQTDISVMADVLAVKLFFFQPMKGHNDKTLGVNFAVTVSA